MHDQEGDGKIILN